MPKHMLILRQRLDDRGLKKPIRFPEIFHEKNGQQVRLYHENQPVDDKFIYKTVSVVDRVMLKTVRFELYQRVEILIHGNLNGHPNLITTFYLSSDGLPVGEIEQKIIEGIDGVRQHLLKFTHTFFYSTYPYKKTYPTGCLRITKPYIDETHAVYHKIESFNTEVAPKHLYVILTNDEIATPRTLQNWAAKSYTKFTQPLSSNEYEENTSTFLK